jgi:hypothetical protein
LHWTMGAQIHTVWACEESLKHDERTPLANGNWHNDTETCLPQIIHSYVFWQKWMVKRFYTY